MIANVRKKENIEVVAVTVTFNSCDYLARCLSFLNEQSHVLKKIIVVDNNSSQNNLEKNRKIISRYSNVILFELDSNTGGAGGFEYGMKKALEEECDYIWIMDDDAYPQYDCLEKLLKHVNDDNVGCVCPLIYGDILKKYQLYHHKRITKFLLKDKPMYRTFDELPDVFEIDSNAFVGPLFSKKSMDVIGVADGSLFIYGDDTDYTYRLSQKYKIVVVKDAVIYHRDVEAPKKEINPSSWWKDYYMYRNRFFFIKTFSKNWFSKTMASFYQLSIIYLRMISSLIKPKFKGYRMVRIRLYKKAINDARKGLKGKQINPASFLDTWLNNKK